MQLTEDLVSEMVFLVISPFSASFFLLAIFKTVYNTLRDSLLQSHVIKLFRKRYCGRVLTLQAEISSLGVDVKYDNYTGGRGAVSSQYSV